MTMFPPNSLLQFLQVGNNTDINTNADFIIQSNNANLPNANVLDNINNTTTQMVLMVNPNGSLTIKNPIELTSSNINPDFLTLNHTTYPNQISKPIPELSKVKLYAFNNRLEANYGDGIIANVDVTKGLTIDNTIVKWNNTNKLLDAVDNTTENYFTTKNGVTITNLQSQIAPLLRKWDPTH